MRHFFYMRTMSLGSVQRNESQICFGGETYENIFNEIAEIVCVCLRLYVMFVLWLRLQKLTVATLNR